MKIRIVEDEPALAQSMAEYLSQQDYLCEQAATCNEAMDKISLYMYDCILLDITLPDGNGMEVLEHLRKTNRQTGVVIISAKGALEDKVNLLANAIRHNIAGGKMMIELEHGRLAIMNTASGQMLDSAILFRRFGRMNTSAKGSGLGLAIVRQICSLYGWQINYSFGDGMHRFVVRF